RDRDRDRACRALRPGAAPPAPRPRRPGPRARPLLPRRAGLDGRGGLPASPHPRAVDRRLPHRRGRPGAARAGRLPRHAAGGPPRLPRREPAPRRGLAARRARRGARVAGGGPGAVAAGVGRAARGARAPLEGSARPRARGVGDAVEPGGGARQRAIVIWELLCNPIPPVVNRATAGVTVRVTVTRTVLPCLLSGMN